MRYVGSGGKKIRNYLCAALAAGCGLSASGIAAAAEQESPAETAHSQESSIWAARYTLTGENPVPPEELQNVLAPYRHRTMTADELDGAAQEVTKYLRSKGNFVAFAYVPPQLFERGIVEMRIVPGHYDNIVINNTSYLTEHAIRREMGVTSGERVEKEPLNRGVWLTSDLSRVEARTQLKAGGKQGTTDLIVNVKPKGNRMWGYVGIDNGGYRYTGRYQYSAFFNYASPFRQGDLFSIGGVRSNGDMWSGSVSYVTPVAKQGEKVGISYARSHYTLGGTFAALGYIGSAETLSIWWQHNFRRSRNFNLYGTVRHDWKDLDESASSLSYKNPKKASNWGFGVSGDSIDNFGTGGKSTFALNYTHGDVRFDDPLMRLADSVTARAGGRFGKYNLSLTRLQNVRDRLALYLSYSRQWAEKNLDASEKFSLGGPYGVRAYPLGEASGDDGWMWTSELRWNLPTGEGDQNIWQLIAFLDGGHVMSVHSGAPAGQRNGRSLYGAGVGVNWSNEANWVAHLHYARRIGHERALSEHDIGGRFWFQLYKFY